MPKMVRIIPPKCAQEGPRTTAPKGKRRVAGYARVSTEEAEQQSSYQAQVEYYTSYITGREDWELVEVYTDEGITGTSMKPRRGFRQMVADALEGKMARCVNVNPVRELANLPDSNASATLQLTMDELQKEDPATILRQYAQQKGETFTDEFASMLETVIKNINSTADED